MNPINNIMKLATDLAYCTDDEFGEIKVALRAAIEQALTPGEPVAWKHDCAALLTNDVELWIDACPHCGKPRPAPQPKPAEQEPVAWRYKKEGAGWFVSDNEPQYVEQWNDIEEIQPLYTAPQPAAVPAGYALVPVEPTEAMLNAARDWSLKKYGQAVGNDGARGCYAAMLAAANKE